MLRCGLFFFSLLVTTLNATEIPEEFFQKLRDIHLEQTPYLLVVNVTKQRMTLFKGSEALKSYVISTAKNGKGQVMGKKQTPLGLHRIAEKFGRSALPYTILFARRSTGKIWRPSTQENEDLVLTRVLWLEGLEEGFNRGKLRNGAVVDSHQRLIYIHATNQENLLGTPASHGCIRMGTDDILELFDTVPKGSLVWIE